MKSRSTEIISSELPSTAHQLHQVSSTVSRQPSQHSLLPSISALNKTILPPKRELPCRLSKWTSEWITDWWGAELICWAIAALSLATIVITLESHKDKPLPQWSFGITLNSFISVFATIGHMAMMEPVAECIHQLKWLWFTQREKLARFQAFEDASKGPKGSLFLLARMRKADLVSLGAAITIASMAFSPFAQQIVTYPLRLHPIGIATTPQVFNYTDRGDIAGTPSPEILASFYQGLASTSLNLSSVAPVCSTGNCTWTDYSSLAICASISDISSSLRNSTCNTTSFDEIFDSAGVGNPGYPCFNVTLPAELAEFTAPSGYILQLSNPWLSNADNDDYAYQGQIFMHNMGIYAAGSGNDSSLVTTYLMYQPDLISSINSSLPIPIAYELNLNLCVQTYTTTVSKGVVNTTIISNRILEATLNDTFYASNDSVVQTGRDTFISMGNDIFGAFADGLEALQALLFDELRGGCYIIPPFSDIFVGASNTSTFCDSPTITPFMSALTSTDPLSNVTQIWNNLATSITNTFRLGAGGNTVLGKFQGVASEPVIFVETQYLWLILPGGLVLFTLVFLLSTMIRSRRLGSRVWKSSTLAVLQGLQIDLHNQLGGLSSISEMEEKAKDIQVRLDMRNGKAEKGMEYRLVESKQEEYWKG